MCISDTDIHTDWPGLGIEPESMPTFLHAPTAGSWPLAHEPEAVGIARRLARSALGGWRVEREMSDSVIHVVSELVTNAIGHANPPVLLHLHRDAARRVWVAVTDGGQTTTQGEPASSCEAEERGRGMGIVKTLAAANGTCNHPGGRATHWARIPT
ncbi:ATP-binding protein [Streptomyces sp. NPDC051776]|uniref:ATP-binding protein n=1 Tax=Streptomyces sp. NPDC051776 TaxID=3155414 RepID=UPI0034276E35